MSELMIPVSLVFEVILLLLLLGLILFDRGGLQLTVILYLGTVRTTKEGDVRWSTVSIFDGQERWRSEGIQVGGRKSARGVWGNWFDR
jgi:hypothetical protein